MVLWGNKKWETHWEMGCGVAAQRGNTSLWWCSPTAAGADTVAKQSLRTTALSCLRTRETNVHTQGLKTENPKRAHCSFFIQAERRHKPSYLWFRGIKFKGWALCVLFCFSLFFFFFFPATFFLKCHSVSEMDFFGLLVGWMDWVIAQYLAYFAQAELSCYWEDIDKLKGVQKRALQQVRLGCRATGSQGKLPRAKHSLFWLLPGLKLEKRI